MRRACATCLVFLVAAAMALVYAPPPARGASGTTINMPAPPTTAVAGLKLTLDCQWVDAPGYCPITLGVASVSPAPADRTLRVQLVAGSYMWGRRSVRVTTNVDIPAGSSGVTKVISTPQYDGIQFLSLDVWEDGVHYDDLSFENRYIATGVFGGQENLCSVLFVSDTPVDSSKLAFLFPPGIASNASAAGNFAQTPNLVSLPPLALDANWINYSSLDVICISQSDVESLATTRPEVWHALRQWVWLGGNLCVYEVGTDWKGVQTLEERLECTQISGLDESPYRGWEPAPQELYGTPWQLDASAQATRALDPQTGKVRGFPPSKPPFVRRSVKLGQVVAVATDKPFAMSTMNWQWIFNRLGIARATWESRHGIAYHTENPSFDNFLISQVGLPPVKTYRVLITLFVIGIGPINYWLLYRKGRLPLLLFTVPAAALLISASLFAYVLVADGLSTYLRARSFTELDQRHHQAVSWARQSYYAALAPARGLVFPADTAVLPIEKSTGSNSWREISRQLIWTDEQRLSRGWLASRTPTQYLTLRAYPSDGELAIAPAADQSHCDLVNRLGTHVHGVWVCDAQGTIYLGKDISSKAKRRLQKLDAAQADGTAAEMLKQFRAHPPEFPSDIPGASPFSLFGRRRVSYRTQGRSVDSGESLLEMALTTTANSVATPSLEPRTYVAIVDRPPGVIAGLDGAIETQSLHVILGRW